MVEQGFFSTWCMFSARNYRRSKRVKIPLRDVRKGKKVDNKIRNANFDSLASLEMCNMICRLAKLEIGHFDHFGSSSVKKVPPV